MVHEVSDRVDGRYCQVCTVFFGRIFLPGFARHPEFLNIVLFASFLYLFSLPAVEKFTEVVMGNLRTITQNYVQGAGG